MVGGLFYVLVLSAFGGLANGRECNLSCPAVPTPNVTIPREESVAQVLTHPGREGPSLRSWGLPVCYGP